MFETSVYKNRRARLKEKVKSGLVRTVRFSIFSV